MKLRRRSRVETQVASAFINLESYTEKDHLIITKPDGCLPYIGRAYEMSPLLGIGSDFTVVIKNLIKDVPENAVIQVNELCFPDHQSPDIYAAGKDRGGKLVVEMVSRQSELFHSATKQGWQEDIPFLNRKTVIVAIAVPYKTVNEENLSAARTLQKAIFRDLQATGFADIRTLSPGEVLAIYNQISNIYEPRKVNELDPLLDLGLQAFGPNQIFDFRDSNSGKIGEDLYFSTVVPKAFPTTPAPGLMNLVIGAPLNSGSIETGGGHRITCPFMICTTVRIADQAKEADRTKRAALSRKAERPKNWQLGVENETEVLADLEYMQSICGPDKDKYVYTSIAAFVFGRSKEAVQEDASQIRTTMNGVGFDARLIEDTHGVLFAQNLPLNFSPKIAANLEAEALMPGTAAARMMPVFGDYTGNAIMKDGNGYRTGSMFITRRGGAFRFDPFVSNGGFNGTVFAGVGSGKSFLKQYLILNQLAQGNYVFSFDVGYSDMKLCEVIGSEHGEFLDFSPDMASPPSLNPFTYIKNTEELQQELEGIISLFMRMAYESHQTPDSGARIALRDAIDAAYGQNGEDTECHHVVDALKNALSSGVDRDSELGKATETLIPRLNNFLANKTRGRFFEGKATFSIRRQFTVIETSGLGDDKHLRSCITFFLMNLMMSRFRELKGIRKFVIVDEAKDLIEDENAAAVLSALYLKGRKDDVGVWVVSQSPRHMDSTPAGKEILGQSEHKIMLRQSEDELREIEKADLGLKSSDPYLIRLLHDLTTVKGRFSEALIMSGTTYEVVRLYVDPMLNMVFSSEGAARTQIMARIRAGEDPVAVIKEMCNVVSENQIKWINDFFDVLKDQPGYSAEQAVQQFKELSYAAN